MIPLNIGKIYRIINTEGGRGLPAYLEWDKAPSGAQAPFKIPEGAEVKLTRHPNPRGYVEVEYKTMLLAIDGEGHLEEVAPPKPPIEQWNTIWEFTLFGKKYRLQIAV